MNQKVQRFAWVLAGLLLCHSPSSVAQSNSTSEFNGRWEASGMFGGPWTFELTVAGDAVSGRVMQHGGVVGPAEIYDGKVAGAVVTFKTKYPIISPVVREITFRGVLAGDEIAFERSVEILLNGPDPGILPVDAGVFGTSAVPRFTARRRGPVKAPAVPIGVSDPTRPADVNGRWESLRWNLDVWRFDLKSSGSQLSGTVSMTAGPGRQLLVNSRPMPIYDAVIEGNTVRFKCKSPDNARTIHFTGRVHGDEIAFVRAIEAPPGAPTGFEAVYGAFAPLTFLAKRTASGPAPERAELKELQQAQQKWAARTFTDYEFTAQWRCLCPMPTEPLAYRVRGGTGAVGLNPNLTALTGLPPEAVRPVLERYATMDQMFAYLKDAVARQPYRLKIDYDPTLGYPASVDLQPGGTSVDDDIQIRITRFQILN